MAKTALGKKILGWPKFWGIWKIYTCSFHTCDSALRISLQTSQAPPVTHTPFHTSPAQKTPLTQAHTHRCLTPVPFTQAPFHEFPQQRNPDAGQHVCKVHTPSRHTPALQAACPQTRLATVPASLRTSSSQVLHINPLRRGFIEWPRCAGPVAAPGRNRAEWELAFALRELRVYWRKGLGREGGHEELDMPGVRLGLKLKQPARRARTVGREGDVRDTGRDGLFHLERSGNRCWREGSVWG